MARIAWKFEDPVANTTTYMPINPNAGASPAYEKTLTKSTSTAPGAAAQVLIFEGSDKPIQFDFSGAILEQSHYDFLYTAWAKRHPVKITDDLGRSFIVYFESFKPTRKVSRTRPWRQNYQATTVIVG